jgi:adenosylcobinamide kinase/adenosylcobinamide-phosphate guanylyltransferase
VDSLGTWVANTLDQPDPQWQKTQADLLRALGQCPSTVILVAEETGWGVVPAYALGRTFRDRLGTLTRQVGYRVDRVYLVVAGYAIDLKAHGTAVPEAPTTPEVEA